jgi:putative transcriptional regulator
MEEMKYGIRHYKLFDLLNRKGISKGQFAELVGLSSATTAKLSSGKPINTTIINKICATLDCQPSDIMEYVVERKEKI